MSTQIFDDGSTLTIDDVTGLVTSTDAPAYNLASAVWTPQSVNPGAGSWESVLKMGLSRIIDAKIRPVRPENTMPLYSPIGINGMTLGGGGLMNLLPWLLIGGVALFAFSKLAK